MCRQILSIFLRLIDIDPYFFPTFWWSETWHYGTILELIFRIRLSVVSLFLVLRWPFVLLLIGSWVKLRRSAELRIHANPGGSWFRKTRTWVCFTTDIVRVLCKNILRVSKNILYMPRMIFSGKDAHLGGILAFKSVKDPTWKHHTFLTDSLLTFWRWSWSILGMNPDRTRYYSFRKRSWTVSETSRKD